MPGNLLRLFGLRCDEPVTLPSGERRKETADRAALEELPCSLNAKVWAEKRRIVGAFNPPGF